MKSLLLLGLTGLAANVQAHPQRRSENAPGLAKRGVDISKFRLPDLSDYTAKSDISVASFVGGGEKRDYIAVATELIKELAPGAEFRLISDHYVDVDGIAHVHFKQTAHGIDIDNADFKVNIGRDGQVFSHGNSFFTGKLPKESPLKKRDFSDPVIALKGAVDVLGLPVQANSASAEPHGDGNEKYRLKGTSGAVSDPEARLVYLTKEDGSLVLTWRVETDVTDNWLLTYVDAASGKKVQGVVDYVSDFASFEVYSWGVNDPTEAGRKVINDPWRSDASPFTWFGNGNINYTTTRGNNAAAQVNPSGGTAWLNNYRPDSPTRAFQFPFTTDIVRKEDYRDASISQLFYTANQFHDLTYILGFDERAGNFQENNNGRGGLGNDFVILNSQDGSGLNNANFATPPDGSSGRMRMYMWNTANPQRDGCFEAGVVIHEYGHGVSTRLTGGPANSGCLSGLESGGMGEGWSDFFATAIRLKPSNTRTTDYPMGAWVSNNVRGIRAYPYSTSIQTNPLTYKQVDRQTGVHAVGTIWASTLYEVLWNLIDKHGKNDADFPTFDSQGVPTDGKYLALKLVISGLSLQPCNPNFVSARDAILDADKNLTGGQNQCELWQGFAKRGLGKNAKYNASSRTEDFTLPDGVC